MEKKYKLTASQIQSLVPDLGFGFVSDKIAVDGHRVQFMVREEPEKEADSGWRFLGGGETEEYLDEPEHISMLEINTVANYDPEIIPFLMYPPGTQIERNAAGRLEVTSPDTEEPEIILLPPVVAGTVLVPQRWRFDICGRMFRRIDGGSLVLWRPGLTLWMDVYTANNQGVEERVEGILSLKSEKAENLERRDEQGLVKMRYSLTETIADKELKGVYLFGFTEEEELHLAAYYTSENDRKEIETIWETLGMVKT
jgi:hypothetical protein